MICAVCQKEISYDREIVTYHLNQRCLEPPYSFDGLECTYVSTRSFSIRPPGRLRSLVNTVYFLLPSS